MKSELLQVQVCKRIVKMPLPVTFLPTKDFYFPNIFLRSFFFWTFLMGKILTTYPVSLIFDTVLGEVLLSHPVPSCNPQCPLSHVLEYLSAAAIFDK